MADSILTLYEWVFYLSIPIAVIAQIVPPLRTPLSRILYVATCFCYFMTWLWCGVVMAMVWGMLPVIIGLVLGIGGVIPVAMVISLFTRHWMILVSIVEMLVECFFIHMIARHFRSKGAERAARKHRSIADEPDREILA